MSDDLITFALRSWTVLAVLMALGSAVERRVRDAGIVDVLFAYGFGLVTVLGALSLDGAWERRLLVAALASTWALRLGTHLLRDRVLRGSEDGRYRHLRSLWPNGQGWKFFLFFQAQALLVAFLATAPAVAMRRADPAPDAFDLAGVLILAVSIGGEWVADRQLARFRSNPAHRGRTCRTGLWRYSRHPNYFFEWLHWLAYAAFAAGAPWGAWPLVPAAVMLALVLWVTGIPPTEAQALRSRGADYRAYQRETSAFVPWFPRTARRASNVADAEVR